MSSVKMVIFFACIAFAVAFPPIFRINERYQERLREQGAEEPYGEGPAPLNQQAASPSYDYGGAGAGADSETESEEANEGGAAGAQGGTTDMDEGDAAEAAEAGETEAAENEAAENEMGENEAAGGLGVVGTGGTSGEAPPTNIGGGPGLVIAGKKSTAGRNAGIAFGVIAAVGLAAGLGYFVYRKRRAAAFGQRF